MRPVTEAPLPSSISSWYFVMLDGRIIGHVMEKLAESLVEKLRLLKIMGKKVIHATRLGIIGGSSILIVFVYRFRKL